MRETTGPIAFWRYYQSLPEQPPLSDMCQVMPYTNKHQLSKICPSEPRVTHTIWNEGTVWGGEDTSTIVTYTGGLILIVLLLLLVGYLLSRFLPSEYALRPLLTPTPN